MNLAKVTPNWSEDARMIVHVNLVYMLDGYSSATKIVETERPREKELRSFVQRFFGHRDNEAEYTVDLHEYCNTYNGQYYYITCGYDDLTDTLYVLKDSAFKT